jgi:hypothetical protein
MHRQLAEVYCDNVLSTHCQMVPHVCIWQGQTNGQQLNWMTKLNNRSKHCTHQENHSDRNRRVTLWCTASDLGLTNGTVQHTVENVLQYCKISSGWLAHVLTNDNKPERMMVSLFPATMCRTGKQLCASGHLVRRLGSIISFPLVSNQTCSGSTLAHPGSSIKWHYLLAKFWPLSAWTQLVWCWWNLWNMDLQWRGYATCCRAHERPSEANILVFQVQVW